MTKGPLLQTKKKRKTNKEKSKAFKNIENKIRILSGDGISFEKINSLINSGCVVGLEGIKPDKLVVAYLINKDRKEVKIAYYGISEKYIHREEYGFRGPLERDFGFIREDNTVNPSWDWVYRELNEKLQMLNKN